LSSQDTEALCDLIAQHSAANDDSDIGPLPETDVVADAGERIARIYGELLGKGYAPNAVGRAAIGAVVSLYDNMDLVFVLPDILRAVADRVEMELPVQH